MIFKNCPAITVFEKGVDADRLETYTPHLIHSVYWEEKRGATVETGQHSGGLKPSDSLLVLIPAESITDYLPKPDDIIAKGELADLPENAYTIREVFDARYGRRTPHIEVRAI